MISETGQIRVIERLRITSYDTGYEHSVEHWFLLKEAVEDAHAERAIDLDRPRASDTERPQAMAQTAGV